jgi:hypothetical protein
LRVRKQLELEVLHREESRARERVEAQRPGERRKRHDLIHFPVGVDRETDRRVFGHPGTRVDIDHAGRGRHVFFRELE